MTDLHSANTNLAPDWAPLVAADLARLDRWFEGRMVLSVEPDTELVPADRFFDLDFLRNAIARAGGAGDVDDDSYLRVAVSRFTRHYTSSLSAVVLLSLARGVAIEAPPARCTFAYWMDVPFRLLLDGTDHHVTLSMERPTSWPVEGVSVPTLAELRAKVWRHLYAEHLAPLFERIRAVTRVSRDVMWTNAAEWVGMLSDAAVEYLGPEHARLFVDDRVALLGAAELPGLPGDNPLRGRLEWLPSDVPGFEHGVQTRKVCCGTYLLAARDFRLCQNCGFMPIEDRVALIQERHGVSMGMPGGAATERSIELGRARTRAGS
jgi:hypothetical protein